MKMKKILSILLVMTILAMNTGTAFAAPVSERPWDQYLSGETLRDRAISSAESGILVDINSGRILFGKRETNTMYPASITKIMTAILAIEHSEMDDLVSIDNTMAELILKTGDLKKCGFQKNESVYMEDLLYGLMLISGADAAIAIAIHVGGTYDNFIQMMNDKAQELGMTKTVYKNPHGEYQSGHVTCAEDMARLTQYAMKFPAFTKIVGTYKYTPTDTDKNNYSAKGKVWYNSNRLLSPTGSYGYDYATGVKTGFTSPSGFTVVSSAEKGDQSLAAVLLKDGDYSRWVNSITMFEYGFKYFDTIDLAVEFSEREYEVDVENAASSTSGSQLKLQLAPKEKVYLTESAGLAEKIRADIDSYFTVDIQYYDGALVAPVAKGQEVGIVTFTYVNNHFYSDYLEQPEGVTNGIKVIKYEALLIAANAVDAMPSTAETEATAEAEVTPVPEDTNDTFTDESTDNPYMIFIYIGLGLLGLVMLMVLLSFLNRRYRYQQYYVRNKREKLKPFEDDSNKDDDNGHIKFNY